MMILLRIALGIGFTILGIIGSILPVMQGWIFFLLAFLVLFPNSPFSKKALGRIERHAPRIAAWLRDTIHLR